MIQRWIVILYILVIDLWVQQTFYYVDAQDLSIYGVLDSNVGVTPDVKSRVNRRCYRGAGFINCHQQIPTDDFTYLHEMSGYLNYQSGSYYCVECCGTNPSLQDAWNFTCTSFGLENYFSYYFHFAQKRYLGDTGVVSCPLPRTGCPIRTATCNKTYLVGYTLTLHVIEYNAEMQYWNGVSSCEATAHEVSYEPDGNIGFEFKEEIILIHTSDLNFVDGTKAVVLFTLFIFLLYFPLYFCRRKHCIVCSKKLVFNKERCYICIFVGAYPPDPVLFRALEEKGVQIQDNPPERFPGSKYCVASLRWLWALMCLKCGDVCSCCSRKTPKIQPEESDTNGNNNFDDETKDALELSLEPSAKKKSRKKSVKSVKSLECTERKSALPLSAPSKSISAGSRRFKWFSSSLSPSKNPNILPYAPEIIYAAVSHHDHLSIPVPGPKNIPESAPGFRNATNNFGSTGKGNNHLRY
jgi:hypothetical protein